MAIIEYSKDEIMNENKDNWNTADIIEKCIIPITIVIMTLLFNYSQELRQKELETFKVSVNILSSPKTNKDSKLYKWALNEFKEQTGIPEDVATELKEKEDPLPTAKEPTLRLLNAKQLNVSIIRFKGTSDNKAKRIETALLDGGYTNIKITEREKPFPDNSEVRFYYPVDSQNAKTFSDYIKNVLGFDIKLNDRSADNDASNHQVGDLNVYIK